MAGRSGTRINDALRLVATWASPRAAVAQDARDAWRLFRRQPAYAALVVATIALGIASTAVLGSMAFAVLLKPLPWADAPRLVRLYETRQGSTRRIRPLMSNAAYLAWTAAPSSTLGAIGAWSPQTAVASGSGDAQHVKIARVTPGLFEMLGASPAAGRLFVTGDEQAGRAPIAILSHGRWLQAFGGRPDAIGRSLRLDGTSYTVVGVMPPAFAFPDRETVVWVPFQIRPPTIPGRPGATLQLFQAVGRLRPRVTPGQAAAEGTSRGRSAPNVGRVATAVFGSDGAIEVSAVPMLQALTGEVRPAIAVLFVAVVLLLATATGNVASLQLARAAARRREMAIRAAIGATRARLVSQALIENLLLALLGGAVGLALAAMAHRALPAVLPADFPRVDDIVFDVRVQGFSMLVAILAGLGCGLLPALHVARSPVSPALAEDSLAPVSVGFRSWSARTRTIVMSVQVAIAFVLLTGALLLGRSFGNLTGIPLGYDAGNLLEARIVLPDYDFTPIRRLEALDGMAARIRALPEVVEVGFSTVLSFTPGEMLSSLPLARRDGSRITVQTGTREVSAGYFRALGQRILEGREFGAGDTAASQRVVIVNAEFARRYLDGRALGWTVGAGADAALIVGVAADTVRSSVLDVAQPELFRPAAQAPVHASTVHLLVRSRSDPLRLAPTVRSIVREAAPGVPIDSIGTMEDLVSGSLSRPRLYALVLGVFAAFALLIAGVGLFGVLSYAVAQRAREIGIRAALGAQMRDIVALVAGQSATIAGAGVALGLIASLGLGGLLRTLLYGVAPYDAFSFAAVAALLVVVATLASVVPARRAATIDPVRVLRG